MTKTNMIKRWTGVFVFLFSVSSITSAQTPSPSPQAGGMFSAQLPKADQAALRDESFCLGLVTKAQEASEKRTSACADAGLGSITKCYERLHKCEDMTSEDIEDSPTYGPLDFGGKDEYMMECSELDKKERDDKVETLKKDLEKDKKDAKEAREKLQTDTEKQNEKIKAAREELLKIEEEKLKADKDAKKEDQSNSRSAMDEQAQLSKALIQANRKIADSQGQIAIAQSQKAGKIAELSPYLIKANCEMEIRKNLNQGVQTKGAYSLILQSQKLKLLADKSMEACYTKMMKQRSAELAKYDSAVKQYQLEIDEANQTIVSSRQRISALQTEARENAQMAERANQQKLANYYQSKFGKMQDMQQAESSLQMKQMESNMTLVSNNFEINQKQNEMTRLKAVKVGKTGINEAIKAQANYKVALKANCNVMCKEIKANQQLCEQSKTEIRNQKDPDTIREEDEDAEK